MSAAPTMSKLIKRRAPRAPLHADFGRRRSRATALPMPTPADIGDDLKLFLSSFVGGLVFMSVYLA